MNARVHCMPLPTPFSVGTVNTYLIEDEPLTLVDTGPDSGTSLIALVDALAERGRRIEDLQRIVLTHQHIDHTGLAGIVAERSGAEVCGLAALGPWLGDYAGRMEAEDRFAERLMRRHGIPREITLVLRAVTGQTRAYGNAVTVTRLLHDGDTLELPTAPGTCTTGRATRISCWPAASWWSTTRARSSATPSPDSAR